VDSWDDNAILRRWGLLGDDESSTVEIRKLRNGRGEYGISCVAEFRVLFPCSPRGTEETHETRQFRDRNWNMTAALLTEPNVQKLHSVMLLLEIMRRTRSGCIQS
jgi:hypothetical protein